jgi:hypothetical protein
VRGHRRPRRRIGAAVRSARDDQVRSDLQGTSFRKGNFERNPADASEVGVRVRFHAVTHIPLVNLQGVEFTINCFYGRDRGIGASASAPFALKIEAIEVPGQFVTQQPNDPDNPQATFNGDPVLRVNVAAEFIHPYSHIFGFTGNYLESHYTNAVFRLEMAYQLGAPFQSAALQDRVAAIITTASARRCHRPASRWGSPSATCGQGWSGSTGRPGSGFSTRARRGSSPASSSGVT